MKTLLEQLAFLLGPKQQRKTFVLFVMMVVGAGFEALGIGFLMPFLALLSAPETLQDYELIVQLTTWLGLTETQEIMLFLGGALLSVYIIKNLYLATMYYFQYTIIYSNLVELTLRLLGVYLHGPYTFHLDHNSADLVRNLSTEVSNVYNRMLLPMFTLLTEGLVVCVIGGLLIIIEPTVTLIAVGVLGTIATGFYLFVRQRVLAYGRLQQRHAARMIKWINQGVGSIKEAKVRNVEDYFIHNFETSSVAYADSVRLVNILKIMPRFVIETLGIGGILTVLTVMMLRGQTLAHILPILGVFGLATIRLMPSATRLISSLTVIRNSQPSLELLYHDLKMLEAPRGDAARRHEPEQALEFNESIMLENIHFRYPEAKEDTLKNLNITIKRGESVAFVGTSGSGKTTSIDVILGLLEPREGRVLVDGIDISEDLATWQKKIGYIAQPIYLLDDTVRRNVAFGIDEGEIDDERVWEAIDAARLREHIDTLPEKLDTVVGEHGARFSGGQRQRLGIARALYHQPAILILDEATSALDNETEREIVQTINALDGERTTLTIAHRLSTVRDCDRVYFLKDGNVEDVGTFDELLERNGAFRRMAQMQNERD